jgi:hypothetical protein
MMWAPPISAQITGRQPGDPTRESKRAIYGTFLDELNVKLLSEGKIELLNKFRFKDQTGTLWVAPKGLISDGASIPRLFWSVVGGPLDGDYRDAAVIHDQYCASQERDWLTTHRAFYYAMKAKGVSELLAQTMYYAVVAYGPRWAEAKIQVCAKDDVTKSECTERKEKITDQPQVGIAELEDVKKFKTDFDARSAFGNPGISNNPSFAETRGIPKGNPLFRPELRR